MVASNCSPLAALIASLLALPFDDLPASHSLIHALMEPSQHETCYLWQNIDKQLGSQDVLGLYSSCQEFVTMEWCEPLANTRSPSFYAP